MMLLEKEMMRLSVSEEIIEESSINCCFLRSSFSIHHFDQEQENFFLHFESMCQISNPWKKKALELSIF